MVLANASVIVITGLVIGAAAAWYLSATSRAFRFGLKPNDPLAFAAAMVTLTLAALVATLVPAHRAATVDPMIALRAE